MANPPDEFFADKGRLEDWIQHNPTVPIDAHDLRAPGADLAGLKLSGADFTAAHLEGSRFDGSDLSGASFKSAHLERSTYSGATLKGASLELAKLDEADLRGLKPSPSLDLRAARLKDVHAEHVFLERANLAGAYLSGAKLGGAKLAYSDLQGVNLRGADLRGTSLYAAELTNTTWGAVRLDKNTNLNMTVWRPEHDAPNDRSDTLDLTRAQRVLSWTTIRFLGEIPLFGGAYLLLILTLMTVTGAQWLNDHPFVIGFSYPIPVPLAARLLLFGSVLLAVGSTVFEVACPARVKEFSRVRWVEELKRPGALYTWEGLKRPFAAAVAMACIAGGGSMVGFVFLTRLARAVAFVAGSFT